MTDPQMLARGMIIDIEHPVDGKIKNLAFPVKFSDAPYSVKTPPPAFGQHTEEILKQLGYSVSDMEELKKNGTI